MMNFMSIFERGIIFIWYEFLIIYIPVIAWICFSKAGIAGWKFLVPFYNGYVIVAKIARKEPYYFFLLFIPLVNIVIIILCVVAIAKNFGKSKLFSIGLLIPFITIIFYSVIAFGSAEFKYKKENLNYYQDNKNFGQKIILWLLIILCVISLGKTYHKPELFVISLLVSLTCIVFYSLLVLRSTKSQYDEINFNKYREKRILLAKIILWLCIIFLVYQFIDMIRDAYTMWLWVHY
ncbi:MAG: DUF5684 domain-containing protein [Fusobacteriaceae bacterium]